MQAEAKAQERLFHCENRVDASTSARIKMFSYAWVCMHCVTTFKIAQTQGNLLCLSN